MVILQKRVAGLSRQALDRFVLRARREAGLRGAVNVLVTSSAVMRSLNIRFRNRDHATDVLSFPSSAIQPDSAKRAPLAGDVAISAEIAARNAVRLGHSTADEVRILALHGMLHLAGFDHERDNGEMARKELRLRRALALPSALIERSPSVAQAPRKKPRASRSASTRRRP